MKVNKSRVQSAVVGGDGRVHKAASDQEDTVTMNVREARQLARELRSLGDYGAISKLAFPKAHRLLTLVGVDPNKEGY